MAKKTLGEIVQDILNDLDADPVNTINDTVESLQVAQIVRSTYEEMMANKNWPHLKTVGELDSLSDTSKPSKAGVPVLCKELINIRYNKRKSTDSRDKFTKITYMEPDAFLDLVNARDSSASNVLTVEDYGQVDLFIYNDRPPTYWTSFDDEYVYFDSYDSDVEDTIHGNKSQVLMYKSPTFIFTNNFTPDLPEEAFPALVEEAKSTAFMRLKQVQDGKSEQKARRSHSFLSRKAWKLSGGIKRKDFSRKV